MSHTRKPDTMRRARRAVREFKRLGRTAWCWVPAPLQRTPRDPDRRAPA
jgi:hypothetical protein